MTPARKPCAVRVAGVPPNVVMWVDHERDDDVLYLNADLITEPDAQHLNIALRDGRCTAKGLIQALMPRKG